MRALPILLAACFGTSGAAWGQVTVDQDFLDFQRKAVTTAEAFADALYPRGTPQYLAGFRYKLRQSYPPVMSAATANSADRRAPRSSTPTSALPIPNAARPIDVQTSIFDQDPRYRDSVKDLVDIHPYIIGGTPTNAYLNVVGLTGHSKLCTGIVVAARAILTAQHCFCDGMQNA